MTAPAAVPVAGNRCGYVRGRPRLALAIDAMPARRPAFIDAAMLACDRIYYDRRRWPELCQATDVNYKRGERLEAIVRVCKALILRADYVSLRIGWILLDDRCTGVSETELANMTALNPWRVQRALADLRGTEEKPTGLLKSVQPREKTIDKDGRERWRGFKAIRTFAMEFFHRLGLADDLKRFRKWCYDRREREDKEHHQADAGARRPSILQSVLDGLAAGRGFVAPPVVRAAETIKRDAEHWRVADEVYAEHPEWTPAEIETEAQRRIRKKME